MKLDLDELRKLSVERAKEGFKTYENVPITYWTTAISGEHGELCNMIKKIERVKYGGIDGGSSYTAASLSDEDLKEEIGGIAIYLDLLASLLGISLEDAIIDTFNSKSKKYGFKQFLPSTQIPSTTAVEDELRNLRQWKKEAELLLDQIEEYAAYNPDIKVGMSKVAFVLDRAKKYDELQHPDKSSPSNQSDAVEFAEWASLSYEFVTIPIDPSLPIAQRKYRLVWVDNEGTEHTTAQLYEQFKKEKQ